jgi:hypothetical protein
VKRHIRQASPSCPKWSLIRITFQRGTTLDSLREWIRPEAEQRGFTPDQAIGIAIKTWMNRQMVEIEEAQLEKLREYEALKGTSIEDAVNEAVAV